MKIVTKRLLSFLLVCSMLAILSSQSAIDTSAATTKLIYEYSPMLVDRGNIYYIQSVENENYYYELYQLEVASGNKTKLLTSKMGILNMMIHNNTLYYTSYEGEQDTYQIYSISLETKKKKIVCDGQLVTLDDSSFYYLVLKGQESKLYKRSYESKKSTLLYTGNTTFSFVKNLDNTLYFTQFNEATLKLTLFALMPEKTKLTTLTSEKITLNGSERSYPTVSDIIKINGDLYYQYGAYEGSGNYWYGKLMKLAAKTKKKSVIVKQLYEEQIDYHGSSIFYNGTDSNEKHYQYNTKTGKTTTYTYKTTGTESFNIYGDKTYSAKANGKDLITVSRFTTGTNQKNLNKTFISISQKQNKKYSYSASVKKVGDYLLIPVACTDYNDTTYGWRGKLVSITWYVADSDGKVLTKFQ